MKKLIIFYCYLIGIRKGKRFITYQCGYRNNAKDGFVCWSEITGFDFVRVTKWKWGFDVLIHNYNHDEKFANAIGAKETFIQQDAYSFASFKIKDLMKLLKAQDWLKREFTMLYKP